MAGWGGAGCGKSQVEAALDSDANGYLCLECQTKFYTDRAVFANVCPACKKGNIQPVVGFVCPADQEITIAPRGQGFHACKKCGRPTSALMIPRGKRSQSLGRTQENQGRRRRQLNLR